MVQEGFNCQVKLCLEEHTQRLLMEEEEGRGATGSHFAALCECWIVSSAVAICVRSCLCWYHNLSDWQLDQTGRLHHGWNPCRELLISNYMASKITIVSYEGITDKTFGLCFKTTDVKISQLEQKLSHILKAKKKKNTLKRFAEIQFFVSLVWPETLMPFL